MRPAFSCGAALQGPQWGRRRPAPRGMLGRRPCGGGSGEVQGELGGGRCLPQQAGLWAASWGGHGKALPPTMGGNTLPTPPTLPVVTLPGPQARVLGPHGRPGRAARRRRAEQRDTPTTRGSLWGPGAAARSAADRAGAHLSPEGSVAALAAIPAHRDPRAGLPCLLPGTRPSSASQGPTSPGPFPHRPSRKLELEKAGGRGWLGAHQTDPVPPGHTAGSQPPQQ